MAIFKYDQKFPCPTDKYAIEIHKEFEQELNRIMETWKKGVASQLMMYRGYADLEGARITAKATKFSAVPVISLKPIIGEEDEKLIQEYHEFFEVYHDLRSRVQKEVHHNLTQPKNKQRDSTKVIALVNILKLCIASFKMGQFNALDYLGVKVDILSSDLSNTLRKNKACHVVGPKFEKGGMLWDEVDTDLIGAFYRHKRKHFNAMLSTPIAQCQ